MNLLTMWFLKKAFTPDKKAVKTKKVPLPEIKTYTAEQFCRDRFSQPWKVGKIR